MKTSIKHRILIIMTLGVILNTSNDISSQTTHEVAVSNFKFEPANLTIAPGDIVKWTNNEGSHNIDGTQTTFPDNPVSFSNDVGAAGWTFSFTFDTEGSYDYRCSVHPSSMTGKITVGNATGIDSQTTGLNSVEAFPNPASGLLNIPFSNQSLIKSNVLTLSIFDFRGTKLKQIPIPILSDNLLQLNLEKLANGTYFYKVSSKNKALSSGKFVKID